MAKKLSQAKAIEMLKNPPHGMALTDKQKQYFTDVATAEPPPLAKMGGWLEKYNDGGPVQPNYNDAQASTGPGYVGTGYDTTGRNYSPAWGGQFQNGGFLQKAKSFPVIEDIEKINEHGLKVPDWEAMTKQAKQLGAKQVRTKHGATIIFDNNWEVTGATDPDPELAKLQMGGSLPGAVGFTYARTAGAAPSNGKYAKKTKASAQNGNKLQKIKTSSEKFMSGWMNSPMYNKMVDASINASPDQQDDIKRILSRDSELNNFVSNPKSFVYSDLNADKPWYSFDKVEGEYSKDSHNIAIDKNIDNNKGFETGVHELSHAIDRAGVNIPKADVLKMWKYQKEHEKEKGSITKFFDDPSFNEYVGHPTETRARLNAIRALGKEQDVYDPFKEKIDKSKLDKIKSSGIRESQLDQLRKIYNDDQIIDMLNSVSKNNSNIVPQAQNGKEMSFYQNGLDWKPNNISKNGSVIKDDRGQWAHPGEITEINSNNITMEGVEEPLVGISNTGHVQYMEPEKNYKFKGNKVTEIPINKLKGWLSKYE